MTRVWRRGCSRCRVRCRATSAFGLGWSRGVVGRCLRGRQECVACGSVVVAKRESALTVEEKVEEKVEVKSEREKSGDD